MYSEAELDEAVAAGAISAADASALRGFSDARRATPHIDEEEFRLITSFNDIFVGLATIIMLVAVGWIVGALTPLLAGPAVAATSWYLALFFTLKRRMALPSIILLCAFVGGISVSIAATDAGPIVSSLAAVGAAYGHWRKFRVPITPSTGAAALVSLLIALVSSLTGDTDRFGTILLWTTVVGGLGVFALAMWWDGSDPGRVSRRSDVAFWLHLLAAPLIVHPVFWLTGLAKGSSSIGGATGVLALYVALSIVALAIDRRALLVSALAYVLWALGSLLFKLGSLGTAIPMTALVIGSALLLLSAFWHKARAGVVSLLPIPWQRRLPFLDRPTARTAAEA
jgi:hypothetical protein